MWFLLVFGLATLLFAVRYAISPVRRLLRTTLGLGAATGFTIVTGVCADLAAVGHKGMDFWRAHQDMTLPEVLLQGFAESMAPAIMGGTMLSLASLVTAVGFFRASE